MGIGSWQIPAALVTIADFHHLCHFTISSYVFFCKVPRVKFSTVSVSRACFIGANWVLIIYSILTSTSLLFASSLLGILIPRIPSLNVDFALSAFTSVGNPQMAEL